MIRKIRNLIEKGEDEVLGFDGRYTSLKKIENRKKHYKHLDLFDKLISENKLVLKKIQQTENRAKAMSYYDELFTTKKNFKELTELKRKGKKIVGTFCNMVPEELIYAAGAIPIRLCSGCNDAIRPAEEAFPRDSCPLIKASLGFIVTDSALFNLCDVVILPATCDGKKKLGELLNDYIPVWMLNLPQCKERNISKKYWLAENRILKKRLQELTGKTISRKEVKNAILLLRRRYDVVRRIMDIRKSTMPVLLGRDAFLVIQASFFDNIRRWITKTEQLCDELELNIKHQKIINKKNAVRVLVTGAPIIMPNFKIPNIIESLHAYIAIDETCAGTQHIYDPVEVDEWTMLDMMRAISERYLMPSMCPCYVKAEDRIDKLMDMIKEYKIDGVIYHTLRLCLLYDIESSKVRDVMEEEGVPFLHINTDYSKEDKEQLRTRIEAFIEIIQERK